MTRLLDRYAQVAGEDVVNQLRQLARGMRKMKLVLAVLNQAEDRIVVRA